VIVLRAGEELVLRGQLPTTEAKRGPWDRLTAEVRYVPLDAAPGLLALDADSIRSVPPPSGGSPRAERLIVMRASARYRHATEPQAGGARRVALGAGRLPKVWPHAFRDGEPTVGVRTHKLTAPP